MKNKPVFLTKVLKSITEINKNEWDSIFPPIAESYNFFKTIEETLTHQFKPYYIAIYENSQIMCLAPCFIMEYPLETTLKGFFKKIILGLKHFMPRLFTLRIFVCGCAAAEGRIGIRNFTRRDIIEALICEMHFLAKKENAALITFKDFSQGYIKLFTPLAGAGFHRMDSYPAVELDVRFKSFEDYLSSLSRATRKGLKRKFRTIEEEVKIELEVTNELGELLDKAYELYLNNLGKSEVQFEKLSKDFFKKISQNMPEETKYFLWRINGKLVAFDLCLVLGDTLVDEYIGMDYDFAYKYHLYYVTFRDILSWCIEGGIHKYQSGALGYDPKKRLDFKFIPEYVYVKHLNRFLNFLFGLLCLLLKPENFDPVLKSVKKEINNEN
jgi:predicted N-acyltransferase